MAAIAEEALACHLGVGEYVSDDAISLTLVGLLAVPAGVSGVGKLMSVDATSGAPSFDCGLAITDGSDLVVVA